MALRDSRAEEACLAAVMEAAVGVDVEAEMEEVVVEVEVEDARDRGRREGRM